MCSPGCTTPQLLDSPPTSVILGSTQLTETLLNAETIQMATWEPTSTMAKAVVAAGFRYCPKQDITYSKIDAWQRLVGFTWPYDVASAPLHMIIDCETFYFNYAGTAWLIELWKGQYGVKTGAE